MLAVLEVATLVFAGHRATMLMSGPPLPRTFVPVESIFPGARGPQFITPPHPAPLARPAASRQAPAKAAPKVVIVNRVLAHPPQPVL